jgi:aspartate/tyrosine/aromatic aminotransferase
MGKHSVTSRLVKCPICSIEVKSRGLHSHLRLVHPNSDIKKELRKQVMSPTAVGERVIFALCENTTLDTYLIKHAGLTEENIHMLADFFLTWLKTGSMQDAVLSILPKSQGGNYYYENKSQMLATRNQEETDEDE